MPKISVIVPVYKAEAYLHSCVDSILSQTFSDFEVILVNDGSPDNSGAICDEYALRDSRVRVIHQENQGQSGARNHALQLARGEWICFVDSDDLIHHQMLELLFRAAEESGAGISMCAMTEGTQVPEGFFDQRELVFDRLTMDDEGLCALHDREEYPAWVACAKLIRKEYILSHLFCRGRVFEDNEAVCHWVCAAKTLARIPDGLYFYRTNPQSTTQKAFSVKRLDYLWALEQIIRFYGSLGFAGMKQRFTDRYARELVNCAGAARFQLGDRKLALKIEKQGKRFAGAEKILLPLEQREELMSVTHPVLIRLYWPVKGAAATLRREGLGGLMKKLRKNLGRGESQ